MARANQKSWVYVWYEKLPEFCYWCGFLGHSEKDCSDRDGEVDVAQWPYDPSLWASPFRSHRLCSGIQLGSQTSGFTSASTERNSNSVTEVRRCLFIDPPVVESGGEGKTSQLEGSIRLGTARYSTSGNHVLGRGNDVSGIGLVPVEVLHDGVESVEVGTVIAGPSQQKKKGRPQNFGCRVGREQLEELSAGRGDGGDQLALGVLPSGVGSSGVLSDGIKHKGVGVEIGDVEIGNKGAKKGCIDPGVTFSGSPAAAIVVGAVSQAHREQ